MNRSTKYNFYLPQNTDLISVSDFNFNFEVIDDNLITASQSWTDAQKTTARANLGLGDAATQAVANNLTTTASGSVLDARQGKTLGDKVKALNCETAYASGINPDNYTTTGSYHVGIAADYSPTGYIEYGVLTVYYHSESCTQMFHQVTTANKMFIRSKPNANSSWTAWETIATNSTVMLQRKIKSYSNLTLPSGNSPYVQLDSYSGLGIDSSKYLVAMNVRGWSSMTCGNVSLVKGSDGTKIYVMASAGGSIGSLTVEYFFASSIKEL